MSEVELMDEVGRLGGWGTFALGVGAAVVARVLAPVLARRGRPLARGAIKQAIIVAEGARVRTAGLREDWQDLVAEARADLRRETGAAGQ